MGKKMKEISKNTQVLTITHLASVAACADNHYFIYKEDNEGNENNYLKKFPTQEEYEANPTLYYTKKVDEKYE